MEKKCKKAKWLSEEALEIAEKRREAKGKGEKERYTHLNAEFQRIARRDKKASYHIGLDEVYGMILLHSFIFYSGKSGLTSFRRWDCDPGKLSAQ